MISKFVVLVLLALGQTSWADDTTTEDFYDANENYGYGSTYTSVYTPTYRSHPSSAGNEVDTVASLDSHPVADLNVPTVDLEMPPSELELSNTEWAIRMVAQDGVDQPAPAPREKKPLQLSLRKARK